MEKIKSGNLTDQRRAFLQKFGSLAVMSTFGVAFFTACGSEDSTDTTPVNSTPPANTPPATSQDINVTANTVTINLAQVGALRSGGGWILITSAQMLVVNNGDGSFSSLTSVCTHSGCDRSWTFTNNQFVCNCHGSRFTTSGAVVTGPANQPLRVFSNSQSGDILTINRG
jgi:cytochrome b6-f complex iron-sulfur subunit